MRESTHEVLIMLRIGGVVTTSDISAQDLSCGGPRDPLFDAFEKVTDRLRFTADVHRAIKPHVCLNLPKADGRRHPPLPNRIAGSICRE
jgi:hypothetical protein